MSCMQHSGPTQNFRRGKITKLQDNAARKVSLELEKKLKEFRKTSLAAAAKYLISIA